MAFAQVFSAPGVPFALHSVPLGPCLPGECLVRLSASTICGSDVHTFEGKRSDPSAPLILGHEGCGHIVALGEPRCASTAALLVSQRVTFSVVSSSCNGCEACINKLPQKCASAKKIGHAGFREPSSRPMEGLWGTYATHILLRPGTPIVPLPDALSDAVAAPANCALATVVASWQAASRVLGGPPRRVRILGCGLLGLYACAFAAARGATSIAASDVSRERVDLALRFGATEGFVVGGAVPLSPPPPVDAVFEVCGVVSAVKEGLASLRPGGALILVGLVHPHSDLAGITAEAIIRKCATIVGVHNYNSEDLGEAVEFLAASAPAGRIPYDAICSPPFKLADLPAAMAAAKTGAFPRVLLVT